MNLNLKLENLKNGDEVVVVKPDGTPNGSIRTLEWSETHKAFRMQWKNGKTIGMLPNDGKGYYAMHSRAVPHFYYSANPAHVKAAKKAIQRAAKAEEKKQKLLAEKRKLISPLLETYRNNEECYDLEYLPPETLERLTVKQLKTFVSWLTK